MVASLIIPTKNRLYLTEKAVKSAKGNLYFSEIIIVDDGSSFDIKKYYDIEIDIELKVISNDLHSGGLGARVCGAKSAKNDILVFLDSDDILLNDGINVIIENMMRFHKYTLMYGNIEFNSNVSDWLKLKGFQFDRVLKNLSLCPFSGLVVRKSLYRWESLSLELPAWQDDDFCLVASRNGLIKYIDVIVAKNTLSEDSISKSKNKQLIGLLILFDKYKELIIENFGILCIFMWRLRQLNLLICLIADDLMCKNNMFFNTFGKILKIFSKTLKFFLKLYFDKVYV